MHSVADKSVVTQTDDERSTARVAVEPPQPAAWGLPAEGMIERVRRGVSPAADYSTWIALVLAALALAACIAATGGWTPAIFGSALFGGLAMIPGIRALLRKEHPGQTLNALIAGGFCVAVSLRLLCLP